jgi:ferrochelatase
MRYGKPSIADGLDMLKTFGCTQILVVPLYPQYSGSTTASVVDAVAHWAMGVRRLPELRFINSFYDDPGYIQALVNSVKRAWEKTGPPNVLVLSFHGVPQAMIEHGDPYLSQCYVTSLLLVKELGLADDAWRITFQSRFGATRWLAPATVDVLQELGSARTRRVDVLCPGFVADCLETLEEIAYENQDVFLTAGGGVFNYIPCLNDDPEWIAALASLVERHLQGWQTTSKNNGTSSS